MICLHPILAIWRIGRDAHTASAARYLFAMVALGLLFPATMDSSRRIVLSQAMSEEMPDSHDAPEETTGVNLLAQAQQRGAQRQQQAVMARLGYRALQIAPSAGSITSERLIPLRSRCSELLGRNGCGTALRC